MNDVAEMLASSREMLARHQNDIAALGPQPVCHHFGPLHEADYGSVEERRYLALVVPALSERGLDVDAVGGNFGVEAWEEVAPSEKWITETVPVMCSIADKAGCFYDGWSWEPSRVSR